MTDKQPKEGALDFRSKNFDPELALEDPNVRLPYEDAEEKKDLEEVRASVHAQASSTSMPAIPGVLGPGGVPLPLTRKEPLQRHFTQEQAPLRRRVKRVRNVLTRMEDAKGPLRLLQEAQKTGGKVKVYTRNDRGIRSVLTGHLLAFDKHFNLALKHVSEVFVAKKTYKRHALDVGKRGGNFVTVADLSIKETDEDEKLALEQLAAKEEQAKAGPSTDTTFESSRSDLLNQFLASSKDIYSKSYAHPSTSTTDTSDQKLRTEHPAGLPSGSSETNTGGSGEAWAAGEGPSGDFESRVRGQSMAKQSPQMSIDKQDARMLELGRIVRQQYNPENYNERWDTRQRSQDSSRIIFRTAVESDTHQHELLKEDEESIIGSYGPSIESETAQQLQPHQEQQQRITTSRSSVRAATAETKTRTSDAGGGGDDDDDSRRYTQARELDVNVSSESATQDEKDEIQCDDEYSSGAVAAGGGMVPTKGGGVSTSGMTTEETASTATKKKRSRKRKTREIRKRYVNQLLVRGENVVLVIRVNEEERDRDLDDDQE